MRHVFWSLLLAAVSGAVAFAQLNGNITGTIVDASGAAVPGAQVNLLLPGGNTPVLKTITTSDGIFNFSSVRPDAYDLEVSAQGFSKFLTHSVRVDPSQTASVPPIKLDVQSTQQTVEVAADAQLVQLTNNEISTTITQQQLQNLPVLDRQISSLFLTQAGVVSGRGSTVINGLRTSAANVTLDGINIQDNFIRNNALDFIPTKNTIEQVAEMTLATSNANPALGTGAAQIVLSTPSGGNTYHGSLYWYNRNSFFSSNDWFNNRDGVNRPFLNQNQLGASVGGHILKDKLFFYTNYEAFRLHQQSPQANTVLTPSARTGIFTYVDQSGITKQANLLAIRGVQIDPAIAALLAQVPSTPNSNSSGDGLNTGGYTFNARSNENRNSFLGKGDYYLTPRQTLTATYSYNNDKVDRPDLANFFTVVPPIFNDDHSQVLSLGWRSTLTPTLTNELRGGFAFSPATFVNVGKYPPYMIGVPLAVFTNPVNSNFNQGRATDTYSLQDNASWVKGRHTLSFGYQSQFIRTATYNDANILPTYNLGISTKNQTGFSANELPGITSQDLSTANSLYSTLAGIITDANQSFNVTSRTSGFVPGASNKRRYTFDTYSGYVSDVFKANRRLSITLGLRYDYYTQFDERDSLALLPVYTGTLAGTLLSDATLNFAGKSVGRPFYNADKNNFAPSVGFAWDPFGKGRTAIRGGYSLSYINDDTVVTVLNNINANTGLEQSAQLVGLTGSLSAGLPAIAVPQFQVPLKVSDNFAVNPNNAVGLPDPNLRTPYVQQYSFSIQHQLAGFIVECRYVGNHGTKLLRAFDYNQVVIKENGFLDDFTRARSNGFLSLANTNGRTFNPNYNANIPGSQPLTVFPQLQSGGLLTNSTILRYIRQGEVGTLAQVYETNGLNGNVQFFRNPNALGTNTVSNFSNSTYNSAQFDLRRRTHSGSQYQFNYTFAKTLSDAAGDGQARFEPFLDINNAKIERARAPFDVTHVFNGNYYVELPYGPGKKYSGGGPVLSRILGGWATSGILNYQSGTPFSILSTRGTLNRGGVRSALNTVNTSLNKGQLDQQVGFFMTGTGPVFISPSAVGADGRGVASDGSAPFSGQIFFNPGPGSVGSLQRRMFNGPWNFNFDASVVKNIRITETHSVQLRVESFNTLNHPSFFVGDESVTMDAPVFNVNNPAFGKITKTFNNPRRLQFALYYRF